MSRNDWDIDPQTLTIPPFAASGSDRIVIGPDIPALVSAYYAAGGPNGQIGTVVGCETFEHSSQTFDYMAYIVPNQGRPFLAFGGVESVGLILSEAYRITPGTFGASVRNDFFGEVYFRNVMNRPLTMASIAANTAAIAGETVYMTTGTFTARNQHAYRIRAQWVFTSGVANNYAHRLRKGLTTAGTLIDAVGGSIGTANFQDPRYREIIAVNTTGADIANYVISATLEVGAFTGIITAAATEVAYVLVEDAGAAGDYSNPFQMT